MSRSELWEASLQLFVILALLAAAYWLGWSRGGGGL
jgi:hypothetical protein